MPGATHRDETTRIPRRGVRRPRPVGQVVNHDIQTLYPWMCHPVRPGETIESMSLLGESWLNSMVNLPQAPMTYTQVATYFVPVTAYGPGFKALFSTDAEDIAERGTAGADIVGAAGDVAFPGTVNQGTLDLSGYRLVNRPWAGEIASQAASDAQAAIVPWVSEGIWNIADTYYGLDTSLDLRSAGLLDNPPVVEPFIRGALRMRHALGTGGIDVDLSAETSLTRAVEALYLLGSPSRTFAEVLSGFGVRPSRSEGMPIPLSLDTVYLKAQDNPQMIFGGVDAVVDNAEDASVTGVGFGGLNYGPVVTSDPNDGIVYSVRPLGSLKGMVSSTRRRNITVDTFGMIIGTVVTYRLAGKEEVMGHMLDATRMLNLGHWGDPSFGGIDELDLISVQNLWERDGTDVLETEAAFNFLNLFLHGDNFSYNGEADGTGGDPIANLNPGGTEYSLENNSYTTKVSCQLNIRTDMVGG